MTITKKLAITSLATLGVVVLLSLLSVIGTTRIGRSLDAALHGSVPKSELTGGVRSAFEELRAEATSTQIAYVIDLLENGSSGTKAMDGAACSSCHGLDSVDAHRTRFRGIVANTRSQIDQLRRLADSDREQRSLAVFADEVAAWSGLYEHYVEEANRRDFQQAHEILTQQMFPLMQSVEKAAAQLSEEQHGQLETGSRAAQRIMAVSRWFGVIASGVALFVAFATVFLVRRAGSVLRRIPSRLKSCSGQVATAAG